MTISKSYNTIAIDIGGTFTDCFVQLGGQSVAAKYPTTHSNLANGFMRALGNVARQLELNLEHLLPQIDAVYYSTTLAMNSLLERTGPKLGLVTTKGFEDLILIGRGAQWVDGLPLHKLRDIAKVDKPVPLIPRDRIVGINERTGPGGEVLRPMDEEDVREKVHRLVNQGARGIVVSFLWAHRNPCHEIRVRQIIEDAYPEPLLGNMPVILSHEVQPKSGEYERTISAILNAYLRESMAEDLGNICEELRANGYSKSVLIGLSSGGLAKIIKTRPIDTFNAGPVSGVLGSMEVAKQYGFDNVVTTDMGGTSFDIGVIYNGQVPFCEVGAVVDRWRVGHSLIETKSIGAGGGSIAWINELYENKIEVGPQSSGSLPGPACYNLGGSDPTVTDADVVLGYINPDYFFGGKIKLSKELAWKSIERKIARPLGIDPLEAAAMIRKLIDGYMGNIIFKETMLKGHDPRQFVLFSFGGAGPTHCCGYGQASQIKKIIASSHSPIFSAYSASMLDICHGYEISRRLIVSSSFETDSVLDTEAYNWIVNSLVEKAKKDIRLEKLDERSLLFRLELDMKYSGQLRSKRIKFPKLKLTKETEVLELIEAFSTEYEATFGRFGSYAEEGIMIENFILWASYPLRRIQFLSIPGGRHSSSVSITKGSAYGSMG